jgi:hypothetical protein
MKLSRSLAPLVVGTALASARVASADRADPPSPPSDPTLVSKVLDVAGGKVAVKITTKHLLVKRCSALPCDAEVGGTPLAPPGRLRDALGRAEVELLAKGAQILVTVPLADGESYVVMFAPPAKPDGAPTVTFKGFVGSTQKGRRTELARSDGGVSFTTRASLCGREVVVGSTRVDGKGKLTEAPVPDPLGAAAASAVPTAARALETPETRHALLGAGPSSSGSVGGALDDDAATAWSPESSQPSFVSFEVAAGVEARALDLTFAAGKDQVTPTAFSVVTDQATLAVTAPTSKSGAPQRVLVDLPTTPGTKCVAVVFGPSKSEAIRPKLSRAAIATTLDSEPLKSLVAGLGGADGTARESILRRAGSAGMNAATAAYPKLDDAGRERVRVLVDSTPCSSRVAFYAPLLVSPDEVEEGRARDRLRRCDDEAGEPLLAELAKATKLEHRIAFAEEAGLLTPKLAIPRLAAGLAGAVESDDRRVFRRGLGKVAVRAKGLKLLDAFLGSPEFGALPLLARVDVLRALAEAAPRTANGAKAFADVAAEAKSFRERFLLLGPAAGLAKAERSEALDFLRGALSAEDPRLRARAVELAGEIPALRGEVLGLLEDSAMRVRHAATVALARGTLDADLERRLVARVSGDPWGLVRVQAADALASGTAPTVDEALGAAVDLEPLEKVRAALVTSLGVRKATSQRLVVSSRATDEKEALEVRMAAMVALGAMCDRESLELLTETAQRGVAPQLERQHRLSAAAIRALGLTGLPDLPTRLQLVLSGGVPDLRDLAKRALEPVQKPSCTPSAPRAD